MLHHERVLLERVQEARPVRIVAGGVVYAELVQRYEEGGAADLRSWDALGVGPERVPREDVSRALPPRRLGLGPMSVDGGEGWFV